MGERKKTLTILPYRNAIPPSNVFAELRYDIFSPLKVFHKENLHTQHPAIQVSPNQLFIIISSIQMLLDKAFLWMGRKYLHFFSLITLPENRTIFSFLSNCNFVLIHDIVIYLKGNITHGTQFVDRFIKFYIQGLILMGEGWGGLMNEILQYEQV